MDRTKLFVASVKAVRLQLKLTLETSAFVDKSKTRCPSQFLKEACDVVSQRKSLTSIALYYRLIDQLLIVRWPPALLHHFHVKGMACPTF